MLESNGNPTLYKGNNLSWQRGRDLVQYGSVNFAYDMQGRRLSKTANGWTKLYHYDGNTIVGEDWSKTDGTKIKIRYLFDAEGVCALKVSINNQNFVYYELIKDMQGNIIRVQNDVQGLALTLAYDAYGNHTVSGDFQIGQGITMSQIVSFRYRGYYYDSETSLYYLQTRYYDPQVGRFINAGSIAYLAPETLNGLNLFAYCLGNPVMNLMSKHNYSQISHISLLSIALSNEISSNRINQDVYNKEFRSGILYGKVSATAFYAAGQIGGQWNITKGKINVGLFGKFSLFNVAGEIGIRDNNFGLALKGAVDVATVSGFAGIIINPSNNDYFVGIEARAAVFVASGSVQVELFGIPVEVGVQIEAFAFSGKLGIGFEDGKFYFSAGVAIFFGGSFYIRI